MKYRGYNAKRDGNESEIIATLVGMGASVVQLSMKDVPDLLVGFRGIDFLAEVKNKGGKLEKGQSQWHEDWQGRPVVVLWCVEDAIAVLNSIG